MWPSWAIALLLSAVGVYIYGLNLRARWRLRHIPGPRPQWLFGNLRQMKPGMHVTLPEYARQFGPVCKIFFGRFAIVLISDPDAVREVCVSKFMAFHDRQYNMGQVGGNDDEANCTMKYGMLSARGKYWAGLRASCERVFHSGQLATYAPLMNSAAEKLAARLRRGPAAAAEAAATEQAVAPVEAAVNSADAAASAGTDKQAAPASDAAAAAEQPADPRAINLTAALATMTLEVIGTSAFGVEFDTDKEESRIVHEAKFVMSPPKRPNSLNRMGSILMPELGRLWFLLASWSGSEAVRGSFKARGFLLGTSQVLLRNARKQLGAENKENTAATGGQDLQNGSSTAAGSDAASEGAKAYAQIPTSGRKDPDLQVYDEAKADASREYGGVVPRDGSLLHHLLRAHNKETGRPFSEVEIMAQGNTFLLAGYETTSTALTFATAALARHPEVEAKLLAEVDAFPWDASAGVPYEHIAKLPYTRAVIDEAMRYWPPVTPLVGLQREATADTVVSGYRLPRSAKLWINVNAIHHDERFWPEPEVFKPERFLEGSPEAASRHQFAYLPFGAGPRKCIGYRFALEEAVITLAQLYRHFTFRLDEAKHPAGQPLDLSSGITLSIKGGCYVIPTPRVSS